MNKRELETVIELPGDGRYEYFVKKVADHQEVWGLYCDGWAMTADDDGNRMIPFWPRREYAEHYAKEGFADCHAVSIVLSAFITEWLPWMKMEGLSPSIFWNGRDSAVTDVDSLLNDLRTELEKY